MKNNSNLIVLLGFAGSGKDLLASKITSDFGYQNIKFSRPVKDICQEYLKRPLDKSKDRQMLIDVSHYLKGQMTTFDLNKKHCLPTRKGKDSKDDSLVLFIDRWLYRENLVDEAWSPDFWANLTLKDINKESKYVFTDVRFKTEYDRLSEMGAIFLVIDCSRKTCEERLNKRDGGFIKGLWDSPLEKDWLDWKYDIKLNGELEPDVIYKKFKAEFGKLILSQSRIGKCKKIK